MCREEGACVGRKTYGECQWGIKQGEQNITERGRQFFLDGVYYAEANCTVREGEKLAVRAGISEGEGASYGAGDTVAKKAGK